MKTMSIARFEEAKEEYEGYCTSCEKFTRYETEPDAEEYECPECGEATVMGAEQALLCGKIGVR